MSPASRVAAVLAAAAVAVPTIAVWEGSKNVGYADRLAGNLPTACFGATKGIVVGKRYTDDECMAMLAQDAVSHGLEISRCLPDELPVRTRAAFTSFAYNVGTGAFCRSTLSRKARAGDLQGACRELDKWVYAGGKRVQGLANRRQAERKLCESGL